MSEPLALVLYERLLPGSQLVNRLQDLKYRVQAINAPEQLQQSAEQARPLLVLADVESNTALVCEAISRLKTNPATKHLPVIAFGGDHGQELHDKAKAAGATLFATEAAILNHLTQLLDQALQVE
jgi:CheY-like chemotaxis protein